MLTILYVLEVIFGLVSFITWFFVLIAAFKDEVIKGVFCLICGIYSLYYAVTENDLIVVNNVPVGLIFVGSSIISFIISFAIRGMTHS